MSKDQYSIDIHCHSTMRNWHNSSPSKKNNYWDENLNEIILSAVGKYALSKSKGVAKYSQSNFNNCIEGGVRVIVDSLYPIERGFINHRFFTKKILGKKNTKTLVVNSTGVSQYRFDKYLEKDDYFFELQLQYDFLINNQGLSPCGKSSYKVVKNFKELQEWLDINPRNLAVIVSIEGAHVLGCGTKKSDKISFEIIEKRLLENIDLIKKWSHPPFFMTFAHHFWNQLCGHATTLPLTTQFLCSQKKGLNVGFNHLGKKVLNSLLSKKNGKRILIDIRHMSIQSRIEYYLHIQEHNSLNPSDRIPIISSHTAVNGFDTIADSIKDKDNQKKVLNSNFFSWSINLSKEEIRYINESNGLIGVMLDKGRYAGIRKLKKVEGIKNKTIRKEAYLQLIFDNIFFYVEAVGNKTAWDILSLGSDFDGIITHFDDYDKMSKIAQLKSDLIEYLSESEFKKDLWFDYSPKDIMHKIFFSNANTFLKKHFI